MPAAQLYTVLMQPGIRGPVHSFQMIAPSVEGVVGALERVAPWPLRVPDDNEPVPLGNLTNAWASGGHAGRTYVFVNLVGTARAVPRGNALYTLILFFKGGTYCRQTRARSLSALLSRLDDELEWDAYTPVPTPRSFVCPAGAAPLPAAKNAWSLTGRIGRTAATLHVIATSE